MGKEMWAVLLGQHKGDTCQSCLLFLVWFQLSRVMIAKRNINKSLQPVHSGFVQCFSSSSAVYVNNTAHVLRKTLIHHSLQKMHMEKRHSQFLHLSANKMTLMVSTENQLWQPQHVQGSKSTGYSNKKITPHQFLPSVWTGQAREMQWYTCSRLCMVSGEAQEGRCQQWWCKGYPPPATSGTVLMLEQLCNLQNTAHSTELPFKTILIYFKSKGFFLVDFLECV